MNLSEHIEMLQIAIGNAQKEVDQACQDMLDANNSEFAALSDTVQSTFRKQYERSMDEFGNWLDNLTALKCELEELQKKQKPE